MAWPFKKENEPEKKPEDQNKAEMDALVERLNASFEQTLKPIRETVQAIQTEWNGIKEAAAKNDEPPPNHEAAEVGSDRWKQETLGPLAQQTILANARLTEREIIEEIGSRWSHIVPKVKTAFSNMHITQKASPQYAAICRNEVNRIIGEEAQTAGLRFDGESKRFFLEDTTSGKNGEPSVFDEPGLTWQDPKSGKVLTPAQQLAKLGIQPDDFAKSVKEGVV